MAPILIDTTPSAAFTAPVAASVVRIGMFSVTTTSLPPPDIGHLFTLGVFPSPQRPLIMQDLPVEQTLHHLTDRAMGDGM